MIRGLALAVALWGITPGGAWAHMGESQPWQETGGALAHAADRNPDPHTVEITLEARVTSVEFAPGERIDAWTYNGVLPGPLIRARVGDRLIVHFTNHLPQPTTVHWHGLRVPIEMDGVPVHSQPEVPTGGSFVYDFVLDDAGLFWYHPHVMSAAQVGFGLYGALLVDDPDDGVGIPDERVLVLSDIGIERPGVFESPDSGGSTGMAFGREGNRLLVNGRERPTLPVRAGRTERWRIVNAAKSRYFNLDLGGAPFTTIGGDGGLQEHPVTSDTLVLAPGERADVIVTPPGEPGTSLIVRALLYDRGYGSVEARIPIEDLFTLAFSDEPAVTPAIVPALYRPIAPLPADGATRVHIDLTIEQLANRSFQYGINGSPFLNGRPLHARLGETQIWTISNKTRWSHPFHLHGFFFQVLDEHDQPARPMAWKDTVDVPYERTVRIIVRFDDRPGMWMFHCHVLDHADGGLMGVVHVAAADDEPGAGHHHEPAAAVPAGGHRH
jgi:FtsP/CotA-like multicopper oxidase with cupredoxin domain